VVIHDLFLFGLGSLAFGLGWVFGLGSLVLAVTFSGVSLLAGALFSRTAGVPPACAQPRTCEFKQDG
jgi:hypothetical protein